MTSREAALLSPALRPRFSCSSAAPLRWARSAAALVAVASLLTAICAMPDAGANVEADADALRLEIAALRLKIARLGEAPSPVLSLQCCLWPSSQLLCQSRLAESWEILLHKYYTKRIVVTWSIHPGTPFSLLWASSYILYNPYNCHATGNPLAADWSNFYVCSYDLPSLFTKSIFSIESLLEANAKTLDRKASILEEDNKLNEAMEHDIQLLINEPDSTKVCS